MQKSPLSICFVGLFALPILARAFEHERTGGEEVQQTLLAHAFARLGHAVSMTVLDYGQPDGAVYDRVVAYKAFAPHAGVPGLRFLHPRWTGLLAALRRADADVYYVSSFGPHVGQVAQFVRRRQRRMIFRVAHDANCDPRMLRSRGARDRWFYQYGLRRADTILSQTRAQQQALRQNYGLDSELAAMLVEAPREQRSLRERDIEVLWVNNMRGFKRPELFVELAARLTERQLHMVGGAAPGFEDLYASITSGAARLPNLRFHGQMPYHSVNALYERARLFVNTSDSEGFPNSYLQAWIRGVPVIAFFDPDGLIARESLGVTVRTLDEMRAAVERLLGDADAWRAMSERCRSYMQREFGDSRVLAPYIAAVRRIYDAP